MEKITLENLKNLDKFQTEPFLRDPDAYVEFLARRYSNSNESSES
ncbi:hypothetical protein SPSYN_02185 [Sporotomaculum syntrophicum]|uniref:Uncharacterized protein n=1 Tax=Sporotomaculum syntrophicum TaxID=182264 RepID=A0A9D2WNZ1_9FIRM|nr:hypothetical protein [Sporotomaculum syntrophicum]KAF1084408.1 hypothetical protein SPSYN_02185 [Sporotomaculum syntrophicum]